MAPKMFSCLLMGAAVSCAPQRSNPLDPEVNQGRLTQTAPVIGLSAPPAIAPGGTLVMPIVAVDLEEDDVSIEVSGLPDHATFDGRSVRFSPSQDQAGRDFDVHIRASETGADALTTEATVTLAVTGGCRDEDLDGVPGFHVDACPQGDDCDDTNPSVHPGAEEIVCDGIPDNDCRPGTPDDPDPTDQDGDGVTRGCGDCNDDDPNVHPCHPTALPGVACVTEVACDGIDNDCDSATVDLPDADQDLFGECSDCDDGTRSTHPRALELCDGVDNDCDGETDEDCP